MTAYSKLAIAANSILRWFGLQIIKTDTLEDLYSNQDSMQGIDVSENKSSAVQHQNNSEIAALINRIQALEESQPEESVKNIVNYMMRAHWRTIDFFESISPLNERLNCPICGCANNNDFKVLTSESIFNGGKLSRYKCSDCGVIFGPTKMLSLDPSMLDLEYRNLYRIYSEGDTTESTIRTFHLLNPCKDGIYLDFGCGGEWSKAISDLRSQGWNIYGFEPSALNSSAFVFSTWEEVQNHRFDGIISHNVLEHIIDPVDTNTQLASLLKDGGTIVHATPCFEYLYEFSHLHVFFFTGNSANILADRSGMKITNWTRDNEFIACSMSRIGDA